MRVHRMPANGVPWLHWLGDDTWACRGCGDAGPQAPFHSVTQFARWAGDMKRAHARCGAAEQPAGLGDPLNRGRAER